jgi:hypothetical protein
MVNDLKEALSALQYFEAVLSDLSTTFDGMVVNDLNENLLWNMNDALRIMRKSLGNLEDAILNFKKTSA